MQIYNDENLIYMDNIFPSAQQSQNIVDKNIKRIRLGSRYFMLSATLEYLEFRIYI